MKVYKIGDSYFEIIGEEILENVHGYNIKVSRYLSDVAPVFKFGGDKFFTIGYKSFLEKEEVTEEEFQKQIQRQAEESWTALADKIKANNYGATVLSKLEVSSRESFRSTFGEDKFKELTSKLGI